MSWLKRIACGILVLAFGCGRPPLIAPVSESSRVVAFGDSLTSGSGAVEGESYPAQLTTLLGCEVINEGIPGELSAEGRRRLPEVLREHTPDLVLLCHGGNDMLRGQSIAKTRDNLDAMLDAIRDSGADSILVGVPAPRLGLRVPGIYKELARKHNIPYEPDTVREVLTAPSLKSDRIHPNAAGYRRIAEQLADLVQAHDSR